MNKLFLTIQPRLLCLTLLGPLVLSATAQQTPPASQAEINQQLMQRIQELEKEVQSLKSQPQPPVVAPPPVPAPAPEPVAEMPTVNEVAPRLKLNFFGDLGYQTGHYYGATNAFEMSEFDMFATARISDKVSLLGEVLFTASADNSIDLDIERLYLKYRHNDYFAATIGRIHTDIGYYNTAFNRGDYFQTTIGRPAMYEFDDQGGFMPMQDLGVVIDGKIPSGKLGLNYVFEVTNGRAYGINVEPAQNSTDGNNSKAVNVNISAKPEWGHGLDLGFSVRHDYLSDVNNLHISETIPVMYVVFNNSKYEFLNEATLIRHAMPGGPVFHTSGFYTQFSRGFGRYRPYFRYSYVNAPENDPIYGNPAEMPEVGRINGPTVGIRYDFTDHSAFKLEYEREGTDGEKSTNGLDAQFAFTF
ncbi:MAG: hypothetical protein WAN65_06550 [Candidatus Sulfotelmatobacter sp.]